MPGFVGFAIQPRNHLAEYKMITDALGGIEKTAQGFAEDRKKERLQQALLDRNKKTSVTSTQEEYKPGGFKNITQGPLTIPQSPEANAHTLPSYAQRPDTLDVRRFSSPETATQVIDDYGPKADYEPPRMDSTVKGNVLGTDTQGAGIDPSLVMGLEYPELRALFGQMAAKQLVPETKFLEQKEGATYAVNENDLNSTPRRVLEGRGPTPPANVTPGNYVLQSDGTYKQVGQRQDLNQNLVEMAKELATDENGVLDEARWEEVYKELVQANEQGRAPYFTNPGFTPDTRNYYRFNARTGEMEVRPTPGGQGVAPKLQRATGQEREELANMRNVLAQVREVATIANPNYVGPLDYRWQQWKSITNQADPRFAEFQTYLENIRIQMRRAATGLQASKWEEEQIERAFSSPFRGWQDFAARLQVVDKILNDLLNRRIQEMQATGTIYMGPNAPRGGLDELENFMNPQPQGSPAEGAPPKVLNFRPKQ